MRRHTLVLTAVLVGLTTGATLTAGILATAVVSEWLSKRWNEAAHL